MKNLMKKLRFAAIGLATFCIIGCAPEKVVETSKQISSDLEQLQEALDELEQLEASMSYVGQSSLVQEFEETAAKSNSSYQIESISELPEYVAQPYIDLNDNAPDFTQDELQPNSYETYSDLDSLGRCQEAIACIGTDLMPTEERGSIGSVKPTGWQTIKYDIVEGKYLYNRCHLIGYQLTAENANAKNLITGTRYMNVDGMLPFENMVADYIKETGNHVLYRVTPVFQGNNLVATGGVMEAKSIEDNGDGICFNVFVYNVQPGITIDYATGESKLTGTKSSSGTSASESETYVLNTNSKKFHKETCKSAQTIKDENKEVFTGNREELIQQGYEACGSCKP